MAKKLAFVVSEDWFFVSHRLSLAKQAQKEGFDVIVITKINKHYDKLSSAGFDVFDLAFTRSFKNPISDICSIYKLTRVFIKLKPDIIHNVGLKISLLSSMAAFISPPPAVINAYTGLGYVFSSKSNLAKTISFLLKPILKLFNCRKNTWVIFQNNDDKALFKKDNLIDESKTLLIKGSGVDIYDFPFSKEIQEPIRVILASRLLKDKGVVEFIESSCQLKGKYPDVQFILTGDIDEQNPMSCTSEFINSCVNEGKIEWWGHKENMPEILEMANIVVLPSYREGLPKVLLEAASVGRALVATDVPGCREIVRDKENGFLVKEKDPIELSEAIEKLLINKKLRAEMGVKSRQIIEAELSSDIINKQFINLYNTLLNVVLCK